MKDNLTIIDGKSVFYRGYYAMGHLSLPDGTPTGGVYGFAAMLIEIIEKLQPEYIAVAWDKPKTNIRSRYVFTTRSLLDGFSYFLILIFGICHYYSPFLPLYNKKAPWGAYLLKLMIILADYLSSGELS